MSKGSPYSKKKRQIINCLKLVITSEARIKTMTNPIQDKPATLLTDSEIKEIYQNNKGLVDQVESVYIQQIELLSIEINKIDGIFNDFTNRNGVLMTIAAFLSFLPPLKILDQEYLSYFLLWTFPFLLIALGTYYFSSLRVQSVIKGMGFAPKGSVEALISLKNRAQYLEIIWSRYHKQYEKVLVWNRCTGALIYAYITSMSSNFYIFVFYGKPDLCTSIILALLSCIVFTLMILWPLIQSERGVSIGGHTN